MSYLMALEIALEDNRIPVTVLTWFFGGGAGKAMFLNVILTNSPKNAWLLS